MISYDISLFPNILVWHNLHIVYLLSRSCVPSSYQDALTHDSLDTTQDSVQSVGWNSNEPELFKNIHILTTAWRRRQAMKTGSSLVNAGQLPFLSKLAVELHLIDPSMFLSELLSVPLHLTADHLSRLSSHSSVCLLGVVARFLHLFSMKQSESYVCSSVSFRVQLHIYSKQTRIRIRRTGVNAPLEDKVPPLASFYCRGYWLDFTLRHQVCYVHKYGPGSSAFVFLNIVLLTNR